MIQKMASCVSCNRKVTPEEKAVKFQCPNCGAVTLWRCEKCRLFSRNYKCPACGHTGP